MRAPAWIHSLRIGRTGMAPAPWPFSRLAAALPAALRGLPHRGLLLPGLPVTLVLPLCALLLALLLPLAPARADSTPQPLPFRCGGDPLTALLVPGAVDDPTIPDPSRGPVPVGGFVVLQWRDLRLQLPRTNNAGAASFTDGKWWWSLEDPTHPRFRLRRGLGDVEDFACEAGA